MATSRKRAIDREVLAKRVPIIGSAVVVAGCLVVGAASFAVGGAPGFEVRLPIYVLTGAVVFVGALLTMTYSPQHRRVVLGRATLAGFAGFAGVGLGTEGVVYALIVVAPDLALYAVSGVVVLCGCAFWGLRNWRTVEDLKRSW